jgi:hypothetical protein
MAKTETPMDASFELEVSRALVRKLEVRIAELEAGLAQVERFLSAYVEAVDAAGCPERVGPSVAEALLVPTRRLLGVEKEG